MNENGYFQFHSGCFKKKEGDQAGMPEQVNFPGTRA
jgi:hypothetical protein